MNSDDAAVDALPLLIADIFQAAGALRRQGDLNAGAAGQTQARWQVLSVLSEGDWTVPRVARRLGITRQGVQRVADILEADGLVTMDPNPDHERSPLLHLTSAGRDTLAQITQEARLWHQHTGAGLDPDDIDRARHVLRALTERCG
jgi:DNA-binding MarR family transcriptional regulator